ncbi:MAG: Asp-tRNA(Asn)/Glu-tRNA(Gln) amidotransferase subunit GatC [Candidatus Kapaibacterium sp.]|jgi:aspartyl-tRNA(Asn)/glutamyl-tRNA(Gln) amidotransferase subunit C
MVTKKDVENVARLAKLEFSDSELDSMTSELNSVLGYIDQLEELDVTNVAPLENMNEQVEVSVLRMDKVGPSLTVNEALQNAPKAADNYFLVPKVIQQEIKEYVAQDISGDEEDELFGSR